MPTDVERQVRRYAGWLEQHTDAGLRPPGVAAPDAAAGVGAPRRATGRRAWRWWVVGAGVAAAIALVVALATWASGDGSGRPAVPGTPDGSVQPSGPAVPSAAPSTAPTTGAPTGGSATSAVATVPGTPATTGTATTGTATGADTPPGTEPATTTTPGTTGEPATTVAPGPAVTSEPWDADGVLPVQAVVHPEALGALGACGACAVGVTEDGTAVGYDPAANSFTVLSDPVRTVAVAEPLRPSAVQIVTVGPDDVAYLAVQAAGAAGPSADLVAVSLSGGAAGTVLTRVEGAVDPTGGSSLVRTADGLVRVGCCGTPPDETVRPAPDAELVTPWLDRTGAPTASTVPYVTVGHWMGERVQVNRSDHAEQRWEVPGPTDLMRGMPQAVALDDGGIVLSFRRDDLQAQVTYRFLPDGGVESLDLGSPATPGAGGAGGPGGTDAAGVAGTGADPTRPLALLPDGSLLVRDGDAIVRATFPVYTAPTDGMQLASGLLAGRLDGLDDVAGPAAERLTVADGCETRPTAIVSGLAGGDGDGDVQQVRIRYAHGCDDATGGGFLAIDTVAAADGTWTVTDATQRRLCLRAATGTDCV